MDPFPQPRSSTVAPGFSLKPKSWISVIWTWTRSDSLLMRTPSWLRGPASRLRTRFNAFKPKMWAQVSLSRPASGPRFQALVVAWRYARGVDLVHEDDALCQLFPQGVARLGTP